MQELDANDDQDPPKPRQASAISSSPLDNRSDGEADRDVDSLAEEDITPKLSLHSIASNEACERARAIAARSPGNDSARSVASSTRQTMAGQQKVKVVWF